MRLTYSVDCGNGVVIQKVIERDRMPVAGGHSRVSETYPNLWITVDSIMDTLYNDEVNVYCDFQIKVVPDAVITHLVQDCNWEIVRDGREKK